VASFAIGGPLGAIMGGKWQTSAVDVGAPHLHPDLVFGGLLQTLPWMFTIIVSRLLLALPVASVPYSSRYCELAPPTFAWLSVEPLRSLQWSLAY
jgi:hypothetical protein